ncbi:MAG: N-formylglutamate amidohydrolase [Acidobacteriota bacterium]
MTAEVCRVTPAAGSASPLVFDSPHSGMTWPADFRPIADRAAILTTWDAFVDDLCAGVPSAGGVLIAAAFPRAYVDVNRAESDIDPELIDGEWPEPLAPTGYTRRGMGLIRRFALPGVPMYDRRLSVADVRRRIETYYRPYRRAVGAAIEHAATAFGRVYHVNCHSMKSCGNAMNVDAGAPRPDIVVSDRRGTTADPALTRWAAAFFAGRGYTVRLNDPYQGGDLVRAFGDPARGRHSLQLELNRAIYMDEARVEPLERFHEVQGDLTAFALALRDRVTA